MARSRAGNGLSQRQVARYATAVEFGLQVEIGLRKLVRGVERALNKAAQVPVKKENLRMVALAAVLEAKLAKLLNAPRRGTVSERLEATGRTPKVPFPASVDDVLVTVTAVLARVCVYFNGDEHNLHTANINNVMVEPGTLAWTSPIRRESALQKASRERGLRESVAQRQRGRTHGLNSTYNFGCRCDACRAAASERHRRDYEKKKVAAAG